MTRAAPATLAARAIPAGIERFRIDDRAAWLARRRADVTASSVAALLNEHPYVTAFGLYALKTGAAPDAEAEPIINGNTISLPPLVRGTVLEPVAPVVLRLLRPFWQVEPCGFYYRDPTVRLGATPDFLAVDPDRAGFGSVQVKTTDQMTLRRGWTTDDGAVEPPLFIVIQAIVEAALTGASWCSVAVLVSGHTLDLHLIDVPIHLGIMGRLRSEVSGFWSRVERGEPPEPDYSRDGETLSAVYRDDNAQELDLTGDNRAPELCAELDGLLLARRDADDRIETIKAELKHKLGHHESAVLADGRRITWRAQSRAMRFLPPTESRVLRVGQPRSQESCYA